MLKPTNSLLPGILILGLLISLPSMASAGLPSFQALVDATEENGTLTPEAGTYAGPVYIDFPITIDGSAGVTIDAQGKGSVVYLESDGVTLKNLRLINSGNSHNDLDSGVQVRGNFNIIRDCEILNCLFGIDLQQCEFCIVKRNKINSKDKDLGQRGDSVRLWYSFHNKVQDNECFDTRDMVVWYSSNNEITGNTGRNSRYSLHFMYSKFNLVENNSYFNNTVGIFLMYSDGLVIRNNIIAHAAGPTGIGIGFKETSELIIDGNTVMYCASGFYIDVSPYQPDTINHFENNILAYNGIGIRFLNDWTGSWFMDNQFIDNLTQIFVGGGKTANRNVWEGNYWSDYTGFDLDKDGVGDTPHEIYSYADRIWRDSPYCQFFKGSPLLETLDFLERLVPLSEPDLLIRDKAPLMRKEEARTILKLESENILDLLSSVDDGKH